MKELIIIAVFGVPALLWAVACAWTWGLNIVQNDQMAEEDF